jgi:hypothetical protein
MAYLGRPAPSEPLTRTWIAPAQRQLIRRPKTDQQFAAWPVCAQVLNPPTIRFPEVHIALFDAAHHGRRRSLVLTEQ